MIDILVAAAMLVPGGSITCKGDCDIKIIQSVSLGGPTARGGIITKDYGGDISKYGRYTRGRIVVDGICNSACTMVLANPNACATPRGRLGFHRAFRVDATGRALPTDEATANYMLRYYPANVRSWLAARGGLTAGIVSVPARQFLPPCKA